MSHDFIWIFKAPPWLSVFVRFRPPLRAGGGRALTPPLIHVTLISTKPLFQFIWCSTYWIQVLIPRLHQFFRKFGRIFKSLRPSLTFFRQIRTLIVTLISTKPLFRFFLCSTYWIQILIPRLHQFSRKFVKIFGSRRPSLIFFRQIRTLSPWYLLKRFFNSFCVQHTGCKY